MQDVGAAIGIAQARRLGAHVEDDDVLRFGHVGQREQIVGRRVDDNETRFVLCQQRGQRGLDVPLGLDDGFIQREGEPDETAGGVRVGETEFGAARALVGGDGVLVVERRQPLDPALDIGDRNGRTAQRHRRLRGAGEAPDRDRQPHRERSQAMAPDVASIASWDRDALLEANASLSRWPAMPHPAFPRVYLFLARPYGDPARAGYCT